MSEDQYKLFDAGVRLFNTCEGSSSSASASGSTSTGAPSAGSGTGNGKGVKFTTQMTIDDDGAGPSHGDPNHRTDTSYASSKLNADLTSYIALAPGWAQAHGLQLGDVAVVQHKGKTAYAVYGDNYSGNQIHGEGSVHLSIALGGDASNTLPAPVDYTVFPGSHTQLNGSTDQSKIDQIGAQLSGGAAPTSSAPSGSSSCCGSSGSSTPAAAPSGSLVWPFATKNPSQYNRVDQGWDIQDKPSATVYAIASGTLHKFNPDPGNFGNDYPTEKLDSSIGGPSDWVYYGHVHVLPGLDGKHINSGQPIATTNGPGAAVNNPQNGSGSEPGWLEIGFAQPGTDAPVNSGSGPTVGGQKMKDLLINTQPVSGAASSATTPAGTSSSSSTCCPTASASAAGNGSGPTTLLGKDNEEKAYNFFIQSGLAPYQAAALVGNLIKESGVDPKSGGSPTSGVGFGIAQWTFPERQGPLIAFAAAQGKPVTDLLVQLQFEWHELNTTYKSALDGLKKTTNVDDATNLIRSTYEICDMSNTSCSERTSAAHDVLNRYGKGNSSGGSSSGSTSSSCQSPTSTPDCQAAAGVTKILCEAKKYDPVNYVLGGGHAGGAAFHKACPTIKANDSACGLDCSGLVTVAVYDAYQNSGSWDTNAIRSDTANWKEVPFSQVQPGDLLEPDAGHVEIIDHVSGGTIFTFGAHTSNTAQPNQVGPAQYTNSPGNLYYHYVGKGA